MRRFTKSTRFVIGLSLALFALPAVQDPLSAQAPRLAGRGNPAHDDFIRAVLARGDYLLISSDTVISRADTVRKRVLVVGATLRMDGMIDGDLIGVGANLFIRPSARITGETRNIAGGLYRSELSTMPGLIENAPNAPYEVERVGSELIIRGTEHRTALALEGFKGLSPPAYDRVNGVTLRAGAAYLFPRIGRLEPAVRGWGTYYSHRGDFGGGGELAITRGGTELAGGAERTVLTNEEWIRSAASNSIAYLIRGKDYRNYYAADRIYARLSHRLEGVDDAAVTDSEEPAGRKTVLTLTGQREDASGLAGGSPWSLFTLDSVRPNDYGLVSPGIRRVPGGRITSVVADLATEWEGDRFEGEMSGLAELGVRDEDDPGFGPQLAAEPKSFARYELSGDWAMAAFRRHTVALEWHFQGPLPGTDVLPYQRWSFIGGSSTLHTFQTAAFTGDRVAFTETSYTIPMPVWMTVRLLGTPSLDMLHYAGMAWTHDEHRRFEQNVGLRLGFRVAYLRVITNPRDFSGDVKVSAGVTFPRKVHRWERPTPQ